MKRFFRFIALLFKITVSYVLPEFGEGWLVGYLVKPSLPGRTPQKLFFTTGVKNLFEITRKAEKKYLLFLITPELSFVFLNQTPDIDVYKEEI